MILSSRMSLSKSHENALKISHYFLYTTSLSGLLIAALVRPSYLHTFVS